jgi:FMN-dependent NADH-azoreductase
MPNLLQIDSSPLGGDSFSRQLTAEYVQRWQQRHPNGKVVKRDLATTKLAPVSAEWIGAVYTPEANLSPGQRELLATSNDLIAELQAADEYVFGVPMHNFSIPSVLKLWIDQIVRIGQTFAYANGAPIGLLVNKKATFLRAVFGFLGVTDTRFIHAGGTAKRLYGVEREIILEPALASIRAQFQAA